MPVLRPASKIADEIIAHLGGIDGADVTATLEIEFTLRAKLPEEVGRSVTFPRQHSLNGDRLSFALLRQAVHTAANDRLRDFSSRPTGRRRRWSLRRSE